MADWKSMMQQAGETDLKIRAGGKIGDSLKEALANVSKERSARGKEQRGYDQQSKMLRDRAMYKADSSQAFTQSGMQVPQGATNAPPTRQQRTQQMNQMPLVGDIDSSKLVVPVGPAGTPAVKAKWNDYKTWGKNTPATEQQYRDASKVIKEYAESMDTFADLKAFLNNRTTMAYQFGEADVQALIAYINANIMPYLTMEQYNNLEDEGLGDLFDKVK